MARNTGRAAGLAPQLHSTVAVSRFWYLPRVGLRWFLLDGVWGQAGASRVEDFLVHFALAVGIAAGRIASTVLFLSFARHRTAKPGGGMA